MTDDILKSRFRVEGMDCAGCANKIDTAVRRMKGVSDVSVSVTAGTMTVHDDGLSDLRAVEKKVIGLGYKAAEITHKSAAANLEIGEPHNDGDHSDRDHSGHDHGINVDSVKKNPEIAEAMGLHGHEQGFSTGPWW